MPPPHLLVVGHQEDDPGYEEAEQDDRAEDRASDTGDVHPHECGEVAGRGRDQGAPAVSGCGLFAARSLAGRHGPPLQQRVHPLDGGGRALQGMAVLDLQGGDGAERQETEPEGRGADDEEDDEAQRGYGYPRLDLHGVRHEVGAGSPQSEKHQEELVDQRYAKDEGGEQDDDAKAGYDEPFLHLHSDTS